MSDIYKRIRERREELGMSQEELAKKMGYKSRSSINKIENGANDIPQSKVEAFAKALQTTTFYLIGGESPTQKSTLFEDKSSLPSNAIPFAESHQAPIVGSIPAGYPALVFEDIEGYASIPYADVENYFFLRVKGDSMINANIRTGDLVLIRKQECAEDGQIVAARVNGDEATLKRYKKQGDTVLLLPENPAYEPKIVPLKEFDIGYAQIIGVAIEVRHML